MEKSGGYFNIISEGEVIKNTFVAAGASLLLRAVFRGEAVLPAVYYLGLTNSSYDFDNTTLANIAVGEPSGHGYARQALTQNTIDWTVSEVNGVMRAISKTALFTASSNWDKAWNRMFLCDQSSGTSGILFSVSGPTPSAQTVLSGAGPSIRYEFYLRG